MLVRDDLLLWFQQLGLPEQTRPIIDTIRSSGPARRVGGGKSNVGGRYPSRKMGVSIQFESHRVELAGIYEMESDPEVRLQVERSSAVYHWQKARGIIQDNRLPSARTSETIRYGQCWSGQ